MALRKKKVKSTEQYIELFKQPKSVSAKARKKIQKFYIGECKLHGETEFYLSNRHCAKCIRSKEDQNRKKLLIEKDRKDRNCRRCGLPATHPTNSKYPSYCYDCYSEEDKLRKAQKREDTKNQIEAKKKLGLPIRVKLRNPVQLLAQPEVKAHYEGEPKVTAGNYKHNEILATRKSYEEVPEHVKFIIDCTALGYSPKAIERFLREKYGEASQFAITMNAIQSYQRRYIAEVEKRQQVLRCQIPIISPVARMTYLQNVVDIALEGKTRQTRTGEVYKEFDLQTIVSSVREMNNMQKSIDEQREQTEAELRAHKEIEKQKEEIAQYIKEQMQLERNAGKSEQDILKEVTVELQGHYDEALKRIEEEIGVSTNG